MWKPTYTLLMANKTINTKSSFLLLNCSVTRGQLSYQNLEKKQRGWWTLKAFF